ncbi:hypothetical protein Anapl_04829 [Anas platyrhynchos]|uniref:Uncharacterized protein n=1 Tax=Anas platyrhynchos TaxID=8839 RepID=R0JQU1_ANAPL|nr:hypothetical protein Anapl_04829 [Anas platyrhynchos]
MYTGANTSVQSVAKLVMNVNGKTHILAACWNAQLHSRKSQPVQKLSTVFSSLFSLGLASIRVILTATYRRALINGAAAGGTTLAASAQSLIPYFSACLMTEVRPATIAGPRTVMGCCLPSGEGHGARGTAVGEKLWLRETECTVQIFRKRTQFRNKTIILTAMLCKADTNKGGDEMSCLQTAKNVSRHPEISKPKVSPTPSYESRASSPLHSCQNL